jgi:arylsulfatase A-like enzyme
VSGEQSPRRRRNVLWVLVDQMRATATGYAGDPNVNTPNLDRMCAEGHGFTRAVAGAPLCCPARGSLITGQYPVHSGVAGHQHPLSAEAQSLAREFVLAGYRTCYVGKWHLDGNRPELGEHTFGDGHARVRMIPPARRAGFEDWWAYENNNRPFDCLVHTDCGRQPTGVRVIAEADGMRQFRLPGYETDALTDIMIDWLGDHTRANPDQPFFAVLSVQPPHNPYVAPESDMARHNPASVELSANVPPNERVRRRARRDLAGYYAAIERVDHNLGRIRAQLAALGIDDDTYVIFFSDHGDMHGSHGQWRKTSPWEESIRVPFVIGGPSRDHASPRELDYPINQVDVAPTTLGLCGLTPPPWMEGSDYSPCVKGEAPSAPDSAYIGIPEPTGHFDSIDRAWDGVVTRDGWKYVCFGQQPWLMFDLNEDPYELVNLAHNPAQRGRRKELHDLVDQWRATACG